MTPAPPQLSTGWRGLEFSIGRIPVLVRPAHLLFSVVFGASLGSAELVAAWVGIVFVSVLIHELGHAAAMRAFGFRPSIELVAMGGFTAWSLEKKPTPGQRVVVTFAGPLAGLALGALIWLGQRAVGADAPTLVLFALGQLVWVNLAWSLVNLLPVLPWDGGLIVDAGAELVAKRPVPKIAGVSSLLVGGAVVAYAVVERQPILGYFGAMGLYQAYLRFFPPPAQHPAVDDVWALIQKQQFAEAERVALDHTMRTTDVQARAALYEAIAWTRLFRDDARGAVEAITKMGPVVPQLNLRVWLAAQLDRPAEVLALLPFIPDDPKLAQLRLEAQVKTGKIEDAVRDAVTLLAKHDPGAQQAGASASAALFHAGAWEPSLQVSLTAFDVRKDAVHLFNAACALVKLGKRDDAFATLQRAVEAGYAKRDQIVDDPDVAPLKSMPGWDALLAKLQP